MVHVGVPLKPPIPVIFMKFINVEMRRYAHNTITAPITAPHNAFFAFSSKLGFAPPSMYMMPPVMNIIGRIIQMTKAMAI